MTRPIRARKNPATAPVIKPNKNSAIDLFYSSAVPDANKNPLMLSRDRIQQSTGIFQAGGDGFDHVGIKNRRDYLAGRRFLYNSG
jgi:hypothetical protein